MLMGGSKAAYYLALHLRKITLPYVLTLPPPQFTHRHKLPSPPPRSSLPSEMGQTTPPHQPWRAASSWVRSVFTGWWEHSTFWQRQRRAAAQWPLVWEYLCAAFGTAGLRGSPGTLRAISSPRPHPSRGPSLLV